MGQLESRAWRWLGMLGAVGFLGIPVGAAGQGLSELLARGAEVQMVVPSPTPRTFGTANETIHVIGASEFDPFSSTAYSYVSPPSGPLAKFGGVPQFAWVRLPAGAVVTSVELEGCDNDGSSQIAIVFLRTSSPGGTTVEVTPAAFTGIPEQPGCGFLSVSPFPADSPLIIDNKNYTYTVAVRAPTATTSFTAVRVYYALQVSPAPAVATFQDVPTTHPYFRFAEALARAGVTVGCDAAPPLFCPDAALTRGQMAAFLSLALGLHFAP